MRRAILYKQALQLEARQAERMTGPALGQMRQRIGTPAGSDDDGIAANGAECGRQGRIRLVQGLQHEFMSAAVKSIANQPRGKVERCAGQAAQPALQQLESARRGAQLGEVAGQRAHAPPEARQDLDKMCGDAAFSSLDRGRQSGHAAADNGERGSGGEKRESRVVHMCKMEK